MKSISIAVGALIVGALLVVAGFTLNQPAPTADQPTGAVAGPDLLSPYFNLNGVKLWAYHPSFRTGTTSVINIKTPAATTTMMLGSGCNFTTASSTAKTIRLSKAAVANASTTILVQVASVANGKASLIATSSADSFTLAPNSYLNVDMQGGAGTDSPAGECSFLLMQP